LRRINFEICSTARCILIWKYSSYVFHSWNISLLIAKEKTVDNCDSNLPKEGKNDEHDRSFLHFL
jgi:hypothetical protein